MNSTQDLSEISIQPITKLNPGIYTGTCTLSSDTRFKGSSDVIFRNFNFESELHHTITLERIRFENSNNQSLRWIGPRFIFRECTFYITIDQVETAFGMEFKSGSLQFQNCTFIFNVSNIDLLIGIGIKTAETSFQNCQLEFRYQYLRKIETLFVRNGKRSNPILFESVGTRIKYLDRGVPNSTPTDGHCCKLTCHRSHCHQCGERPTIKCRKIHLCCESKCRRVEPSILRLFRGFGKVHALLNTTQVTIISGHGFFRLVSGDEPIYINGLTVASICEPASAKWEIGDYRKAFITGFLSNLKAAHEISEYRYPEPLAHSSIKDFTGLNPSSQILNFKDNSSDEDMIWDQRIHARDYRPPGHGISSENQPSEQEDHFRFENNSMPRKLMQSYSGTASVPSRDFSYR